jgi:hypothetical protein
MNMSEPPCVVTTDHYIIITHKSTKKPALRGLFYDFLYSYAVKVGVDDVDGIVKEGN